MELNDKDLKEAENSEHQKSSQDTNGSKSPKSNDSVESVVQELHRHVMSESQLQVKIADLGNSCWTVCL